MKIERHIEITSSENTAVDLLHEATQLSRQTVKQAMFKGAVWLTRQQYTQRIRRADKRLQVNDQLHLYYDDKVLEQQPDAAMLIADEGDYSIWYKPRGMLSQGSKWGDHCTIYRWVEKHLQPQRPAFIVHRLDRATAGLMIIAHKKTTAVLLAEIFQQRQIEKHYQVIVYGRYTGPATIDLAIDAKPAVSHVKILDSDPATQQTLLEVQIETGRKHQVRKHLAAMGFPIVGDRLYGIEDKHSDEDLALTASYLAFKIPSDMNENGETKSYKLPLELQLSNRFHSQK